MTEPRVATDDGSPPPSGLVEAVLAHESALMADDDGALGRSFERSAFAASVDEAGVTVGHEAIAAARGRAREIARGAGEQGAGEKGVSEQDANAPVVSGILVHRAGPGVAHVVSETDHEGGRRSFASRLWRQGDDGRWRIVTEHTATPTPSANVAPAVASPAVDARVWRLVGSPLVSGSGAGPLSGHTVAVKDLFAVAGFRRGLGVRAYLANSPMEFETAPAVRALLDAGADVVGIAQTDQFAYSIAGLNPDYGTPPNPAVPQGIPGGSSSGPASAVSLGQATIGLGTDTAGSIRVPASYQGLWGLRPTHGAIPLQGVAPLAPSYDTVGYLARDGETLLAVASVGLAGAPFTRPAQRVLVPDGPVTPDPDVTRAFREAALALAPNADRVGFPRFAELFEAFRITQQAEAWRSDGAWVTAHPGTLAGDVAARFAAASGVTAQREREAIAERDKLAAVLDATLGDAVLLIPATASAAPSLTATDDELEAARAATLGLTTIAGITGRPALSVPLMSVPGGPVGISLVGPRGSDLALIRMAISWARNSGAKP